MQARRIRSLGRLAAATLTVAVLVQCAAVPAQAGVKVVEKEDFTLELGLRMQPRWEMERVRALSGSGKEWQRDFLVRRTRWKANGRILSAVYSFEWRIDQTDQAFVNAFGAVENAWLQYPLHGKELQVRAGLYDQPFSRDRLTSDSKQLAVDRGAVSNVPAALGLADNAVGLDLRGDVRGGRYSYAVGLFDNRTILGPFQQVPMVVGRLDFNFGKTNDIYQDAHFGDGSWYCLAVNGSYHGSLRDSSGVDDGSNAVFGVDGLVDVPAGPGRLLAKTEFNNVSVTQATGGNSLDTRAFMLGAGYLFLGERLQPIIRWDHVERDDAAGGGSLDITYVGANFYQKGHSLKVQGDLRFESSTGESLDGGRLQAQVDF